MPLDATARHVFAYGGSALQMADEHTMVTVAGNALQFTSTVTHSQHFLMRNKPRKLLAFDFNWRNSEIAVTSRDPNPEILVYSYPDKKLRGKLQNGAVMEYAQLTYSRCGRRLLTVRGDEDSSSAVADSTGSGSGISKRLCVWDMEKLEPLKGCANASVTVDVAFASFDPCDADHFVLGGSDGLQLWKIYKGRASHLLRHVAIKLTQFTSLSTTNHRTPPTRGGYPWQSTLLEESSSLMSVEDLAEKRRQFVCHAWMRQGRVLVANRAGELVMVDTTATAVSGSELTGVVLQGATRASRCVIVGVVYTSETIVVAYADGCVAWLGEKDGELLQSTMLPCYAQPVNSGGGGSGGGGDASPSAAAPVNLIATMAPSPNYSKVYVGTVHGHVFELKVSVALDDDEELEDDVGMGMGMPNQNPNQIHPSGNNSDDASLVASRLISSVGSFHCGAVLAATTLTPSGGSVTTDLVIASGGPSGRVYLWSVAKCRSMGEADVVALFATSVSALVTTSTGGSGAAGGESTASALVGGSNLGGGGGGGAVSQTVSAGTNAPASSTVASSSSSHGAGVVITALVARAADPILLVGDNAGKLRALSIAKVVGSHGTTQSGVNGGAAPLEFVPLHAVQLLPTHCALDVLEIHPTQPFLLAASTRHRGVFVLSLDHEKHFPVLAYAAPTSALSTPTSGDANENEELIVDVKWSVPPHSPAALSFTFYTSTGRLYLARYQDTSSSSSAATSSVTGSAPLPLQLKPKVIAHGEEMLAKCAGIRFLTDAPVNVLLAVAPQSQELLLLKYADLVIDPNERVPFQIKVLAQDAHDAPGIAAVAVYSERLRNGEQLLATAGMNGAITIWMLSFSGSSALQTSELLLEDVLAAKKKTLLPHLGVITSIQFIKMNSDVYLVTTGADGCVYLLDVRLSSDMLAIRSGSGPEAMSSPLYVNVANFAKYEDPFKPESDLDARPFLSVWQEELELQARNRFDRLKDKTRSHLNDLEMKLKILLAENDKLPPSERLSRDEFVVNTAWRDAMENKNRERALAVREGIQRDLAKMNIVRERMKTEFWDSASVPGVKLRGLAPPVAAAATSSGGSATGGGSGMNPNSVSALFVYNFPMRKLSKTETMKMKRIELLRLVEYEHQRQELQAQANGASSSSSSSSNPRGSGGRARTPDHMAGAVAAMEETSWTRFHDAVSPNLQWLINAGLHHPSLNRWVSDKLKAQNAAVPTVGAPAPAATGAAAAGKATTTTSNSATEFVAVVPPGTSPFAMPVTAASLNETSSFHLAYHPAALRTRKQQRMQIQLLKGYVRFLLVEFNREFQEVAKLKMAKIEEIEAKNARICEICAELGNLQAAKELFRPKFAPDEIAASILEVAPDEMTQLPYESEAARRQREVEAAQQAEQERQRQKDDVAGRALKDMMDGTLEVKKENLVSQVLVKDAWMVETPVDEMTAEQKKLVAAFEAAQQKLKDEQDKYKKSLDLELKKIRTDIQEICRAFDDKIRNLQDVALGMKNSVLVQQLYELRLAEDLMEHEHLVRACKTTETKMLELQQEIRVCEKENELFAVQVEACKDGWHRAAEDDKGFEKAFLRELEESLAAMGGVVLEHELVKQVVELYKKRKGDDIRFGVGGGAGGGGGGGGAGGAGGAGPKRGKSNMHLNGGDSKHRLLAEAASEQSSRTLAAATLLQNLQSSSGSNGGSGGIGNDGGGGIAGSDGDQNFDPFAGVDMPPAISFTATNKTNGAAAAAAAGGGAAAVVRHVVPLDYETDRPDGVMIDDRVWRALNELRTKKILAEHTVREKAEQFAQAKTVAEELRVKLEELQSAYEDQHASLQDTKLQLTALAENAPLLIHLKQGQDETGSSIEQLFTNKQTQNPTQSQREAALLVARASVESLNDVIQLHGKDQVGILGKIKNFRKNINVMEWEHTLLEMQTRDMEERYTDIQLLRVTKDLQELFHTGDTSEKQKRELAMLEAKMDHLGKHHQTHLIKLDAAQTKLDRQRRERLRENQAFAAQVAQLEMQVQIREDILMSRKSAALRNASPSSSLHGEQDAGESEGNARLKAITVRRKLVDLARAQTEEIEFLRMELDKMRRRTFPTFAQQQYAAANNH